MKTSNIKDQSNKVRAYTQEEIDSLDPVRWGKGPIYREDGVWLISNGTQFIVSNIRSDGTQFSTEAVETVITLTAAEYTAIVTKDPNTLYLTV